jgi:hypothetical protein
MGLGLSPVTSTRPLGGKCCQLVVRRQEGPAEFVRFILEGLEVGQQVVAMAGAGCLTDLARALGGSGLHLQTLLRSGRLIFLTAPDCLGQMSRPDGPLHRSPIRRPAPIVRWVSDWSWAYSNGGSASVLLEHQRRVHGVIRSLDALSLCTVHSSVLERRALLAVLADHRQAVKGRVSPPRNPFRSFGLPQ